jgi:hypothetical protein
MIEKISPEEQSWHEYRRLVLNELERLNDNITALTLKIENLNGARERDISDLRVKVGMLEVKSGIWGAVGGSLASLIAIAIALAMRHP